MTSAPKMVTTRLGTTPSANEAIIIPPGYKQTEVGVVPLDWSVEAISSVADVKTGPFGSALHERDYVDDGTPIITVEHLNEHGISHHELPLVSDADRTRLKSYGLRSGDIVFSRVGSIDRNALVSEKEDGWLFSGRLLRVRTSDDATFSPYLSYHFHSESFKTRVRSVAVGQTMASLNTQILKAVYVVLPPTSEQRAIAEALSDVDKLLGSLEKLIAKKRAIKQAAMQQLLTGKTRLPGFGPSGTGGCIHGEGVPIGYKHTEAGVIPSEWQAMRVGALFRVEAGGDFNPARSSNVQSDSYPYPIYANSLSQKGLYGFCNYAKSQSGSITVTARGTLGKSFYRDIPFTAIGRLLVLEPKVSMDARFFSEYINYGVHFAVESTGVPQLTAPQVARYLLPAPPEPEQRAIAAVLSDIDTEIAALERRRDKTRAIKQGMMQQLLTGRVRLAYPKAPVEKKKGS